MFFPLPDPSRRKEEQQVKFSSYSSCSFTLLLVSGSSRATSCLLLTPEVGRGLIGLLFLLSSWCWEAEGTETWDKTSTSLAYLGYPCDKGGGGGFAPLPQGQPPAVWFFADWLLLPPPPPEAEQ